MFEEFNKLADCALFFLALDPVWGRHRYFLAGELERDRGGARSPGHPLGLSLPG